ncbi:hypothetical protein [Nonomuraea zeae]|uniref:Contractile injection system tube protein N-terminal domain-containing protein n=1 Tax=Nonomuraea zeae TaxID=1642303 RepID=A0A5S4GTS9_9ACTN|nr:hypothetical protein [Nonomuraea zeae]TMR36249.1 hypothetical protein ETD85_11630 [Nonomuraea zeae]
MTEPAKARLYPLSKEGEGPNHEPIYRRLEAGSVTVQFNPATLTLQHPNSQDAGGKTTGTQKRQYPSVNPATLGFSLEFDTAELADAGGAKGVRTLTEQVLAFARPGKNGQAPPPMAFVWGGFEFRGIVTSISEEIDFFDPQGVPLRAKLTLAITEQDPSFEAGKTEPARRSQQGATPPGGTGAAPGRSGTATPDTVVEALDGESAQQLATRAGGDPAAWRSVMNGLDSPLGLRAGTQVQIGPELRSSGSPGRATGFAATPPDALAGPVPPAAAESAGFVLTQAGGLARAAARSAQDRAERAADAARAAFGTTRPPAPAAAGSRTAGPGGSARAELRPDPRAQTYGLAVPLRARARTATPAEPAAAAPQRCRPCAAGEQRRRDAPPGTIA